MKKVNNHIFLILALFFMGNNSVIYAQWPVTTNANNPQGQVFGTVAEYRAPYTNAVTIDGVTYNQGP